MQLKLKFPRVLTKRVVKGFGDAKEIREIKTPEVGRVKALKIVAKFNEEIGDFSKRLLECVFSRSVFLLAFHALIGDIEG